MENKAHTVDRGDHMGTTFWAVYAAIALPLVAGSIWLMWALLFGTIQPGGLNLANDGVLSLIGGAGVFFLGIAFWCFLAFPATEGDSMPTAMMMGISGTLFFGMAMVGHLLWTAMLGVLGGAG